MPAEIVRQKASALQHAIVRDRVIDDRGIVVTERELHYLSCVRCAVERLAEELGRESGSRFALRLGTRTPEERKGVPGGQSGLHA